MDAFILNIVMLVGVIVVFAIIHPLVRRIPFDRAVPRERFRWPVWNWYAITVAAALVATLTANLWYHYTIPTRGDLREVPAMWSYDGGQPINNPYNQHRDADVDHSEIQPVSGQETPVPASSPVPTATPQP